jgi:hypothetical protein
MSLSCVVIADVVVDGVDGGGSFYFVVSASAGAQCGGPAGVHAARGLQVEAVPHQF